MLDEATLRRLYLVEQHSIRDIATLKQVTTRTVYDLLTRYRIPRRASGFSGTYTQHVNMPFDETTLRRLYLEEERSIRAIAALYQVSTRMVYDGLSRYRIPRRRVGHRRAIATVLEIPSGSLDEAALRQMYEEQGQSIAAIAAALACSPSRIRSALVRWGIARRRRGRRYNAAPTNRRSHLD